MYDPTAASQEVSHSSPFEKAEDAEAAITAMHAPSSWPQAHCRKGSSWTRTHSTPGRYFGPPKKGREDGLPVAMAAARGYGRGPPRGGYGRNDR